MPLVQTRGAASAQGFGEFAQATAVNYIEDVFSTYLYQGTSANQTITNGIDLSTKGGLVWCKGRPNAGYSHRLFDTARGVNNSIATDSTAAQFTQTNSVTAFNTTGFSLGSDGNGEVNFSGSTYVGWTFRKQAKFFDIVTYTGTGANRTIAHNLGSVPGSIIIKRTDATAAWAVYHRSLANTQYMVLNTTAAAATGATYWNSTTPTSSVFSVGTNASVNASGGTYVAYIFAHNAGGFGLTGTDNVISCGSYVGDGTTTQLINLGFEPQCIMVKISSLTDHWFLADNMRGLVNGTSVLAAFRANTADAELTSSWIASPTPVGFTTGSSVRDLGDTYLYIAIRRGPMKVPTSGTSVFGMSARSGTGANATVTGGQTDDAVLVKNRGSAVASLFSSRLTGTGYLVTATTAAEVAAGVTILQANPWDVMDGVKVGTTSTITNASANTYINYLFKRAPSFMDVVCYTGTGVNRTVTHNLGAVPEIMIVKMRSSADDWGVYTATTGNTGSLRLNTTGTLIVQSVVWNNTSPTASVFTVGTNSMVNANADTYVAYLFATCAGVSKVFSYTGNGSSQTINCGFTAGSRWIMIKRTDSAGDWYVWDSARGIIAGNDPHLSLNTIAAEVTTDDSVDTDNTGFIVNQLSATDINVTSATYIGLAIA